MKKAFTLLLLLCMIFSISSCRALPGNTLIVHTAVGKSEKFSKIEINQAMIAVKKKFWDFEGCTLTDLWYNEKDSDSEVNSYFSNGEERLNGAKAENVIVLYSNFKVNKSGGDGSFEPNSTYTDWKWILTRDSKSTGWKIYSCGYA